MSNDTSINEGLERIGLSLQQLIDQAQESLSKKPSSSHSPYQQPSTSPPPFPQDENTEKAPPVEGFVNYSYQFVQRRYIQSQEKLIVAIEQLEQSIQNLAFLNIINNNTTTTASKSSSSSIIKHHYPSSVINNTKDSAPATTIKVDEQEVKYQQKKKKPIIKCGKRYPIVIGIAGMFFATLIISYYAVSQHSHQQLEYPHHRKYDTTVSIGLLACSLYYRKKRKQQRVINLMDRFIIRMYFERKSTTFTTLLIKWLHQANLCFNSYNIINKLLLL
jgi:hypothetical protein